MAARYTAADSVRPAPAKGLPACEDRAMTEQKQDAAATVLVYSDDRIVRGQIRAALGGRVRSMTASGADQAVEVVECATAKAAVATVEAGDIDLCILDGEAVPAGGMSVCRTIKDEIADCPPVLLIVGRRDDAWLASWSRAEAIMAHPVDPVKLPTKVAEMLAAPAAGTPATA